MVNDKTAKIIKDNIIQQHIDNLMILWWIIYNINDFLCAMFLHFYQACVRVEQNQPCNGVQWRNHRGDGSEMSLLTF